MFICGGVAVCSTLVLLHISGVLEVCSSMLLLQHVHQWCYNVFINGAASAILVVVLQCHCSSMVLLQH
jgi:hypothetical protein